MKAPQMHVPEDDLRSLQSLVRTAPGRYVRDRAHIQALSDELANAEKVPTNKVPPDVVTLNSRVLLRDMKSGEETEYTLVLPERANVDLNKISVVAPVGAAILGRKVGEVVTINAPAGTRRLRIKSLLYQPEAAAAPERVPTG